MSAEEEGVFGKARLSMSDLNALPLVEAPLNIERVFPGCAWRRNRSAVALAMTHYGEIGEWSPHKRLTAFTCDEPHQRGLIAGPLHTMPRQWSTVGMYLDMLRDGDRVVAYVGDALDEYGSPIAYPPLHMHHIHIVQMDAVHWFETHGDYAQGSEGYAHALPAGYCSVHHGRHTTVEAQVNDVRFAGGVSMAEHASEHASEHAFEQALITGFNDTSPGLPTLSSARVRPLAFYLRAAFSLSGGGRSCTPASKLFLFNPHNVYASRDIYERYGVPHVEAVYWWRYTLPRSGTLLRPVWVHSHRARYGGLLIVQGNTSLTALASHAARGEDEGEFECAEVAPLNETVPSGEAAPRKAVPSAARAGSASPAACRSAAAMRSLLVERAGRRLVCHDDPATPSFVRLAHGDDGFGGYHDRPGAFHCREWHFRAGEVITLFSFNVPLWNQHLAVFPQHTMVFAHYVPTDNTIAESEFVKLWPEGYSVWKVGTSRYSHLPTVVDHGNTYIVPGRKRRAHEEQRTR